MISYIPVILYFKAERWVERSGRAFLPGRGMNKSGSWWINRFYSPHLAYHDISRCLLPTSWWIWLFGPVFSRNKFNIVNPILWIVFSASFSRKRAAYLSRFSNKEKDIGIIICLPSEVGHESPSYFSVNHDFWWPVSENGFQPGRLLRESEITTGKYYHEIIVCFINVCLRKRVSVYRYHICW